MQNTVCRWLFGALLALPFMALQVALSQGLASQGVSIGAAIAQEQEQKKQRKTRRTPALRNKVYERLSEAQTLIEEKNYDQALRILRDMERETGKKALNSYELANLYNTYAFVYYTMEDYKAAQQAYFNVVKQPDIPLALEVNTRYTIAQLHCGREEWRKGIDARRIWFELAENPGAQAYVLLGQGYYYLGDEEKALKNTLRAINMFREKGKVPKEQWLNLARYLYFEKRDMKNTLALLEELVIHYPKKQYWVQLSYMYGEANDEGKQLSAMETAYIQDMLVDEREQIGLAHLFLNGEVPYKAAKVLDKGIGDGSVENTTKNLEVLGDAWRQAQEVDKSIPVMEKAADKSDKGELYCRLGAVYLDDEQYKKTISVSLKGLAREGVKRPGDCQLRLGMAYYHTKQYDKAGKAFRKVDKISDDKRTKKYAIQWLNYMNGELEKQRKLAAALKAEEEMFK